MGIEIKGPVEVKIEFDGDEVKTTIHYETICEYGSLGRKGVSIPDVSPIELKEIDKSWALQKAQDHENKLQAMKEPLDKGE
jgi:hypothetical protein